MVCRYMIRKQITITLNGTVFLKEEKLDHTMKGTNIHWLLEIGVYVLLILIMINIIIIIVII